MTALVIVILLGWSLPEHLLCMSILVMPLAIWLPKFPKSYLCVTSLLLAMAGYYTLHWYLYLGKLSNIYVTFM